MPRIRLSGEWGRERGLSIALNSYFFASPPPLPPLAPGVGGLFELILKRFVVDVFVVAVVRFEACLFVLLLEEFVVVVVALEATTVIVTGFDFVCILMVFIMLLLLLLAPYFELFIDDDDGGDDSSKF